MTQDVSRRSLLALGAGLGASLGASAMLGGSALAKAPKLGTQSQYFYRFNLGNAEVSVVSDGPLPLGPPKGTFIGVPDEEGSPMREMGILETPREKDEPKLMQGSACPECGNHAMIRKDGCDFCTACGAVGTCG